jgi:hypothetical protein
MIIVLYLYVDITNPCNSYQIVLISHRTRLLSQFASVQKDPIAYAGEVIDIVGFGAP